eukprot:CAMPEP_0116025156 /NCGR_PEP_ID=MMETSP0321-20121206/12851_1 /TAXON_ID=163516 /ORGANISM="Leptocylindrus danicus var. danicus, Strain B650" /LENGTH=151 /DNA_ID=CAMNT_0003497237 /DNA_START=97 /DNA_END=552 /DNA_ORIENTATION=-
MSDDRYGHCAVSSVDANDIFIFGGDCVDSTIAFDTKLLQWKTGLDLANIPEMRCNAAAVLLKDRYVAVIGGDDENANSSAGFVMYDTSLNHWTSTPASMDMVEGRFRHSTALLGGRIVVSGGGGGVDGSYNLTSMEFIDVDALLQYVILVE